MDLDFTIPVSTLLEDHPNAAAVFLKRKMLCVGCPTESFHTLEDVAHIYGIELEQLMVELLRVISGQSKAGNYR